MTRYTAITGMHDRLPEEAVLWQWVECEAARVFGRFGFHEIRTPIVERAEVFLRSIGETTDIVEKEMYTFDSKGGEALALRPEGTASVVRAYVENALHKKEPVSKLYYLGPMFRYEKPQKGRYRQFHQIGAEILGSPEPMADCETIVMLWSYLQGMGLTGLSLELNTLGCGECRPGYLSALRAYAAASLDALCKNCRRRLDTNPLRLLDCKEEGCAAAFAQAPRAWDHLCAACAAHFATVRSTLSDLAVPHALNARIVRGLDYYVRTAFEATATGLGAQNAVAGGGRYDGLVRDFGGPDVPGVGFAIGIERVVACLPAGRAPAPEPPVFVATLGDEARRRGYALATRLREAGIGVEVTLGDQTLKAQMRRADKLGARLVLILGESELKAGRIALRDMVAKTQEEVPLDVGAVIARLGRPGDPSAGADVAAPAGPDSEVRGKGT